MRLAIIFFTLLTFISNAVFSQKTDNVKSDKLEFLEDQKILNLRFDYQDMKVGEKTEEQFLEEKRQSKNSLTEGSGDKWIEAWQQNKREDFPRRFTLLFNKYLAKKNLKVVKDSTATYTLTVKTVRMDPGFHTGTYVNSPAFADMEFLFSRTEDPGNVIYKLKIKGVEGAAGWASFDAGIRMGECYAKAGKLLAKYIYKFVGKN